MNERLPYAVDWPLGGGEPTDTRSNIQVSITMRWTDEPPISRPPHGSAPVAWYSLTLTGRLDAHPDDLTVRGRGRVVKRDGTVGIASRELTLGRLGGLPTSAADLLLDAWLTVARRAGRDEGVTP